MKSREARFKAASCDGKVQFDSFTMASIAAKRRKGRSAYQCKFCGKWHTGIRGPEKPMGE